MPRPWICFLVCCSKTLLPPMGPEEFEACRALLYPVLAQIVPAVMFTPAGGLHKVLLTSLHVYRDLESLEMLTPRILTQYRPC
jgi:hypothetical protein